MTLFIERNVVEMGKCPLSNTEKYINYRSKKGNLRIIKEIQAHIYIVL